MDDVDDDHRNHNGIVVANTPTTMTKTSFQQHRMLPHGSSDEWETESEQDSAN
jgi:hypothetical protein